MPGIGAEELDNTEKRWEDKSKKNEWPESVGWRAQRHDTHQQDGGGNEKNVDAKKPGGPRGRHQTMQRSRMRG